MNLYGRMIHGAEIQWLKMDSDSVYHVFTWSRKQFDNNVCIICCTLEQLLQYSYLQNQLHEVIYWTFYNKTSLSHSLFHGQFTSETKNAKNCNLSKYFLYHLTSSKNYYSKVLLSYGLPSFYMRMYACSVYQPSEFIYLALSRSDW